MKLYLVEIKDDYFLKSEVNEFNFFCSFQKEMIMFL